MHSLAVPTELRDEWLTEAWQAASMIGPQSCCRAPMRVVCNGAPLAIRGELAIVLAHLEAQLMRLLLRCHLCRICCLHLLYCQGMQDCREARVPFGHHWTSFISRHRPCSSLQRSTGRSCALCDRGDAEDVQTVTSKEAAPGAAAQRQWPRTQQCGWSPDTA